MNFLRAADIVRGVKLVEITPATGPRIFHDAACSLYAGDPNRIAPLDTAQPLPERQVKLADFLLKRPHYREIELSWVGDYNPRMRKVYEQIGAVQKKVHVTYRFLFDPSRPFERFTNEGGNSALRRDAVRKTPA